MLTSKPLTVEADARHPGVFDTFVEALTDGMSDLDRRLHAIDPGVRDMFAGIVERVRGFKVKASSTAGRKKPLQRLGSTSAPATRTGTGYVVDKDRIDVFLEARRTPNLDEIVAWSKSADGVPRAELREWMKSNPPPFMGDLVDASPRDLAETLLHELVHVADYLEDLELEKVIRNRGVFDKVAEAYYSKGDETLWYAASDPTEAVAELVRLYVFGTEPTTTTRPSIAGAGLSPEAWRRKYPLFAEFVEDVIFGGNR